MQYFQWAGDWGKSNIFGIPLVLYQFQSQRSQCDFDIYMSKCCKACCHLMLKISHFIHSSSKRKMTVDSWMFFGLNLEPTVPASKCGNLLLSLSKTRESAKVSWRFKLILNSAFLEADNHSARIWKLRLVELRKVQKCWAFVISFMTPLLCELLQSW